MRRHFARRDAKIQRAPPRPRSRNAPSSTVIIRPARNKTEIKSDMECALRLVRGAKKIYYVHRQSATRFLAIFRRRRKKMFTVTHFIII